MPGNRIAHVNATNDHSWPIGLQSYWTDSDGFVHVCNLNGCIENKKPKNKRIAARRRGHEFIVGSIGNPWNYSFEDMFSRCDNDVHRTVRVLEAAAVSPDIDPILRMTGQPRERCVDFTPRRSHMSLSNYGIILELIFSLSIRSVRFREAYSHAGQRFGLPSDPLIGQANIAHKFGWIQMNLKLIRYLNANMILLTSNAEDFIYSDGFYGDIDIICPLVDGEMKPIISGELLIPLKPDLCIFVTSTPEEITEGNVFSLKLRRSEARSINSLTRAHAITTVFCRHVSEHIDDLMAQDRTTSVSQQGLSLLGRLRELPACGRYVI